MKRIAVTVAVAALVVTASALSGLIPSAGLLNGVWADDEAKGTREQRDEKVLLDQVPPPVKATIERESAGGQVTGISQVATDDDPEMALLRRRGERQVQELIAALPVELREPLILCELEELSHKEIADITHTPIATRREL
jgi:DNA-directed RNA polymerase specialized sigma24 family protein